MAILFLAILIPQFASGTVGVGVTTGKINLDEPVRQGSLNTIPSVTVVNTGDESAEYTVGVGYLQGQEELRAPEEWFTFTPGVFPLEPGETQRVDVKLDLPVRDVKPGDYLAYLEAEPVDQSGEGGATSIGVAAATKLYFTVAPANIFQGLYYRGLSIVETHSPWSYVILVVLLGAIIVALLRRYVSFEFGVKMKQK
ncbi:MAG: hypothetical protein U5L75_00910 [Candidatus Campbellbacteria bacterium]|nr:hypothetical protein [Candidatus Campbellbacteria bacterium]